MAQESVYLSAILLCQQILKSEGKEKLVSLINIFDNLVVSTNAPVSTTIQFPIECYLFTKLADKKPRGNYELVIEIFSPSGKKLVQITGTLQNKNISKAGSIGDILQPLHFTTDEDGDHLIIIKIQDQIIGERTLYVSREFTTKP